MTRRARARIGAAIAVACLLSTTACDIGGGPSPSPSPTVQPSPPETSLERQKRLDFEAAEKSYRTFMAEYNRLAKAGGSTVATPVMKETAAGPFLEFYVGRLRDIKAEQVHHTSGVKVGWVHTGAYSPEQLTLEVCEDGSDNKVIDKNGQQVSTGQIGLRSVYSRPIDGRWKAWNGDERGTATSCQS